LRKHPRVTALPHIGSATHETRYAMARMATTNLLQVLAGEPPEVAFATGPR
jgi:gluconate 2-dehydrogenase